MDTYFENLVVSVSFQNLVVSIYYQNSCIFESFDIKHSLHFVCQRSNFVSKNRLRSPNGADNDVNKYIKNRKQFHA